MRKKNTYSRIVQAVSPWGERGKNFEKGKMINLLHTCVEQDITSFQASDFDGYPIDRTFGTALSETGLGRDEFQLIAKYRNSANTKKDVLSTVNDLLITLRTDYLDLLLLDDLEPTEDFKEVFERLAFQGKVLEFGGLELNREEFDSHSRILPLRANEVKGSSWKEVKSLLDTDTTPAANVTSFVWMPQQLDLNPDLLREFCEKYGADAEQLAFAWILQHKAHVHPVIDFTKDEKILNAVASKEIELDPVDWQKINLLLS